MYQIIRFQKFLPPASVVHAMWFSTVALAWELQGDSLGKEIETAINSLIVSICQEIDLLSYKENHHYQHNRLVFVHYLLHSL